VGLRDRHAVMQASFPLQRLNRLIDFQKTWYEHYAIRGHPHIVLLNFLQTVKAIWLTRICEVGTTVKGNEEYRLQGRRIV
jgi:hypothetical protein